MAPLRERLFPTVFVVLAICNGLPIWLFTHQPLPDLGNHLAATSILAHLDDPIWDFARYYEPFIDLVPYWGYYAPAVVLTKLVGLQIANRLLLSFCVVGLPIGMWLLAKRYERSAWLAILAFPLVWHRSFMTGFVSFAIGLALLPFALVVIDRFYEKPTAARGVAVFVTGTMMAFSHPLPWMLFLAISGLTGLVWVRAWRDVPPRLFAWCLSAGWVFVFRGSQKLHMSSVANKGIKGNYLPVSQLLPELYSWTFGKCRESEDAVVALLWLIAFVGLWITGRKAAGKPSRLDWRAAIAVGVGLVCYLALPKSLLQPSYWWAVNVRFAAPTALFAILLVRGPIEGARRWFLALAAIAAFAFAIDQVRHFAINDRFIMRDFDVVANQVPKGARVQFLVSGPFPDESAEWSFPHAPVFQAYHGGYSPWNFDEGFPLKYRVRFPSVHWRTFRFDWDKHAPYWDYVMAFQQTGRQSFGAHVTDVTQVAQSGRWILWKLPGPRRDDPPKPAYPAGWEY